MGLADTGKRVARTLNGGETWTRSILPAPGVAGASDLTCRTMRCVAVGGSALYMNSVNGGVDWLTVNYVPGMSAIDCQTSFLAGSVCVSGGMSDIGTSATDGAFWHAPIEGVAALNVFSVSCAALPSCVALTGTNVLRSVDGGDRWLAGPAPWSVTAGAPTGGTCVGALFCVAVGGSSVFTSLTGTLTWSLSTVPGGPMLGAVSCPTTALCFALDKTNGIVYRGARTVGGLGQPEWSWRATDLNLDPSTAANAIACPTATTCEIVGTAGTTLRSDDGGITWSQVTTDTADAWGALSCPSATLCVAGGGVSTGPDTGKVLLGVSDDGGATWTRQVLGVGKAIATIDCPSTTLCVAAGDTVYTGHP